jgi:HEAT repeat protein
MRSSSARLRLAVISVFSPDSLQSADVNYEWAFALGSGVPVLPVLLGARENDLHPRLRTLHFLDFTSQSMRPWDSLMKTLRRLQSAQRPTTLRVPRDAPPAIQRAARALDSVMEDDRAKALDSLGDMDHPSVVAVLADAVQHPVQQMRFGAAVLLAQHKDPRAVPALLEGIGCEWPGIKPYLLGGIGPTAAPVLIEAIGKQSGESRYWAVQQLGRIGTPEALDALKVGLRSEETEVRKAAASGLESAADPHTTSALLDARHDPDRVVRREVIRALVKCADVAGINEELLSAFLEAWKNPCDQVAVVVTDTLQKSGDPRAIAALVRAAFTAEDENVASFGRSAVSKLGPAAGPALREIVGRLDGKARVQALSRLDDLKDEQDFPLFRDAIRHQNLEVRRMAVHGLASTGKEQVILLLIESLHDTAAEVRETAARLLGTFRDPAVFRALVECLQSENEELAKVAASSLGSMGTREARRAVGIWKKRRA